MAIIGSLHGLRLLDFMLVSLDAALSHAAKTG